MERRGKSRGPGKRLATVAAAVLLSAAVAGALLWNPLSGSGQSGGPKTAAIVDQLSLTQPGPAFVDSASGLLEQAGYVADYYPGDEVTVDLYRNLPSHGYDLILLRVHSGLAQNFGRATGYVSLFSGEPFAETKYARETAIGLLGRASYYDGGTPYFGIVPAFVESMMTGRFDGAVVVLMGCDGLRTAATADALIEKGARAVVGWNGRVSAAHTDLATERLLRYLLVDGLALREAVAQTMADVGPDPLYGSILLLYPSGRG